jgi:hypothetical protein
MGMPKDSVPTKACCGGIGPVLRGPDRLAIPMNVESPDVISVARSEMVIPDDCRRRRGDGHVCSSARSSRTCMIFRARIEEIDKTTRSKG